MKLIRNSKLKEDYNDEVFYDDLDTPDMGVEEYDDDYYFGSERKHTSEMIDYTDILNTIVAKLDRIEKALSSSKTVSAVIADDIAAPSEPTPTTKPISESYAAAKPSGMLAEMQSVLSQQGGILPSMGDMGAARNGVEAVLPSAQAPVAGAAIDINNIPGNLNQVSSLGTMSADVYNDSF